MGKTIISVVMPVYNGEKYLNEAIDSVLNQSFIDFEFIIVNDGSTDSSESIILKYKDSRIKYIKQENTGLGGALRNGCNFAEGVYIARMDSDDICVPQRFEFQKEFLDKNPSIVLVSNSVIYIDESGNTIGRSFTYNSNFAIKKKFKQGSAICHPSVMMRRSAYISSGGYKDLELLEDLYLWIKLSQQGKLHNLSTPFLRYRILNNSVSRSITKIQNNFMIQFLIQMCKENNHIENNIIELNRLYRQAKIDAKGVHATEMSANRINLVTSKEYNFYKFLKKLKLSESLIETIICNLKNFSTYFQIIS